MATAALVVVAVLAYLALTAHLLHQSSLPAVPCGDPGTCLEPLLGTSDRVSLRLLLWTTDNPTNSSTASAPAANGNGLYQWRPVETCRQGLDFAVDEPSKIRFRENCTLVLPDHSRMRRGRPLLAKFLVLRQEKGTEMTLLAEAPFDLTRLSRGGIPHYKYRGEAVTLRIVADRQGYDLRHPHRADGVAMVRHRDRSKPLSYHPLAYVDDTALKHAAQAEMAEAGEDRPPVTLRINVSVISPQRDVVQRQLKMGMEMAHAVFRDSDLDEIRHLIRDDYIYRFVLTQIISFVHIWMDWLAFKDEIGFYRGKQDMAGLSASTVLSRFVCSLIIFLYLMDGGGTSWLVLFGVGSGVVADFFKVWKVLRPEIAVRRWGAVPLFSITLRDPSKLSLVEKETTRYDRIASNYLGLALYPLVLGSALYARKIYKYPSWWSWLITNLANAVYTFGFIGLCPQLYINYRLKSVAHLPMKVFCYKIFNTFVDDVFAFLVEMPLKHKLMTLRDDVVFVGFLVQAYLYHVDVNRVNEYGYAYDESGGKRKEGGDERKSICPNQEGAVET